MLASKALSIFGILSHRKFQVWESFGEPASLVLPKYNMNEANKLIIDQKKMLSTGNLPLEP